MSINFVAIKGRLTKDIELRYTQSGTAVTTFTLAVDRKYSKEKETDFISCQAWQKTAEFIAEHFSKGQEMLALGRIQIRQYEKDGQKRIATDVVVNEVDFCGSKPKPEASSIEDVVQIDFTDADLPF